MTRKSGSAGNKQVWIAPTSSYELPVPMKVKTDLDDTVVSLWLPKSNILLQISSYKRLYGQQVSASQRLEDRIAKLKRPSQRFAMQFRHFEDVAGALMSDDEGNSWLHVYAVASNLAIYATVSGPADVFDEENRWALSAIANIRPLQTAR